MPCVTGPHDACGIETYACHRCLSWKDEDCDECMELADEQRQIDHPEDNYL